MMANRIIQFSPPDISELEINQVVEALKSGWITTGPKTKLFEKKIAEYVNTEKVICLNSATAALELVLKVLGVGIGDEVIVPAYTYTASASVIDHVGAKIVMVDSMKDSIEMDYDKLYSAINERTKVIIPVDIAGKPCNYKKIFEVVNSKKDLFKPNNEIQQAFNRVIVLADAAHAIGASYDNKMVGAVADFTAYSFHAVKNLTTAEGGALTWRSIEGIDSEEIYRKVNVWSLHGQTKDALSKMKLGSWEYDIEFTGQKCNMTDIMAGIGMAQLERYEKLLDRRFNIISKYKDKLEKYGVRFVEHVGDNYRSSFHLAMSFIDGITVEQRNQIIINMAEKGVACNVHYKPLPMLTAYKNLGFDINDYPNAYANYSKEITLPLHTLLSDEDVDYVIECYIKAIESVK